MRRKDCELLHDSTSYLDGLHGSRVCLFVACGVVDAHGLRNLVQTGPKPVHSQFPHTSCAASLLAAYSMIPVLDLHHIVEDATETSGFGVLSVLCKFVQVAFFECRLVDD